ncbi:Uncharacterised protein [Candidatus Norongarragalina meridionalis]|nr:Uncharacterised protein [Candidatus Norongarragalina meridionalis]
MGFWIWAAILVLLLTDLRYEIVNFLGGLDVTALIAIALLVVYLANER